MSRQPKISYVVWHTQRTGSTLLCTTLEATGIAGHPAEWPENQLAETTAGAQEARDRLWSEQTTSNDVLGVKWSFYKPWIEDFFRLFSPGISDDGLGQREAWQAVFPNCHHIMMTRRNKVRLAVSWWKSICGGQGHLSQDGSPLPWQERVPTVPADLADAYDFEAIKALSFEAIQREAELQELHEELGVSPLVVVYEDFIQDYDQTIIGVLDYLGLGGLVAEIPRPLLSRTSNHVDEEWVDRFLSDLNSDAK